MAERGRGIGRRARRSPARPGGRGLRAARRGPAGARGRGDAAGAGRSAAGVRPTHAGGGRANAPRSGAQRPAGRGGGGKQRRVCARLRSILEIRARCAFGLVARFEVLGRGRGMPQCVLGVACAGQRDRPWCEPGPGAERSGGRGAAARRRAGWEAIACPGPPSPGSALYLIHALSSIIQAALTPALSRLPFTPAHLSPSLSRRVSRDTRQGRERATLLVWVLSA
ncbi:unnamed protein product [Coccothraustes coccothraustes]